MNSMNDKPENMTRVMLVSNNGITLGFAFYKDGMFQEDNSSNWYRPDEYDGWFDIKEVKFKLDID